MHMALIAEAFPPVPGSDVNRYTLLHHGVPRTESSVLAHHGLGRGLAGLLMGHRAHVCPQ